MSADDLSELADELYYLYHSDLSDEAVRYRILGIAARLKEQEPRK